MDMEDCVNDQLAEMGFEEGQYKYSHILFMAGVLLTEGTLYDDKDKLETGMLFAVYSSFSGQMKAGENSSPIFNLLYKVAKTHQYLCHEELDFEKFIGNIQKMQSDMRYYFSDNYKEIFSGLKSGATGVMDEMMEVPDEQQ